jgi:hypothetical protein
MLEWYAREMYPQQRLPFHKTKFERAVVFFIFFFELQVCTIGSEKIDQSSSNLHTNRAATSHPVSPNERKIEESVYMSVV